MEHEVKEKAVERFLLSEFQSVSLTLIKIR